MGPTPWPPPRPASRSDHRSHCVKHAVLQHPFGSTMPTSYPEVVWCPFGEHAWGQGSASAPLASGSVRVMRNHTINQPGMMNPPARDLTPVAKSSFYSANSDKFHPLGTYPVLGPMLRALYAQASVGPPNKAVGQALQPIFPRRRLRVS